MSSEVSLFDLLRSGILCAMYFKFGLEFQNLGDNFWDIQKVIL